MAAKEQPKLSFIDIVTRADAQVIRQALEARIKIDDLLVIREEAYKKIAEIENEIEGIVGEEGTFEFGEPPYPVSGFAPKKVAAKAKVPSAPVIVKKGGKSKDVESSIDGSVNS